MTASLTFDHFMSSLCGNSIAINPVSDTFKLMLVNGFTPNMATNTTRADVTSETTGTGYSTGGMAGVITTSLNTSTHVESITLSNVVWSGSNSFSATGGVGYSSHGGASSGDPVWFYIDFGGTVTCLLGSFTVSPTGPLTITN